MMFAMYAMHIMSIKNLPKKTSVSTFYKVAQVFDNLNKRC